MSDLTIAGTGIRRDAAGRYCLNDLHRASGGASNHRPGEWLRNKQTQELVAEIGDAGIPASAPVASIKGGDGTQGTFVAKELVYAYAMWISAAFHLKVIRAYDALVTMPAPLPDLSDPQALRSLLLGYTEKVMALQAENAAMAPKAAFADAVAGADNAQPIGEVAKVLGTGERRLFAFLRAEGILMRRSNLPMQQHVDAGRFRVVERSFEDNTGATRNYAKTLVTGKGLQFIQSRLARASITQE